MRIWVTPPKKPLRTVEGIAEDKGTLEWIMAERKINDTGCVPTASTMHQ